MLDLSKLITAEDKALQAASAQAAEMLAVLTGFRKDREQFLNRLAGIGLAAQVAGDNAVVQSVMAVRLGLLDLTADPAVLAAVDVPILKLAMKARYAEILSSVPPVVVAVFKEVDQ